MQSAWDLTGLLSKYINIHFCGIKADAFDCLKRNQVELYTARVSVCPSCCLSPLHLGSGVCPGTAAGTKVLPQAFSIPSDQHFFVQIQYKY